MPRHGRSFVLFPRSKEQSRNSENDIIEDHPPRRKSPYFRCCQSTMISGILYSAAVFVARSPMLSLLRQFPNRQSSLNSIPLHYHILTRPLRPHVTTKGPPRSI
ncbi:uncharacterized protein P174DRAFT_51064 [Aspergillus novofumigatus IBT 16806]|uniref:Uncharacterized protein n=1 Tax=Aspergillus novofumigatus (strain IBT 16806) TaxID=1392255 RepID=A0A2I1CPM4_ASPN1|nr:uncharacterized protein P174DRAFT_51064 [Aspergillus novofumigatus IBT 16806]PKX99563.1 hypothetical protein P174DRAFT_51064 [Aspergillus novofumigatus IBT 16806]